MKKINRFLAFFFAIMLLFCSGVTSSIGFKIAYATCRLSLNGVALTGNPAQDIVKVALANSGRTGSSVGATENWCADFVWCCAEKAGISENVIPHTGGVTELYNGVLNAGGWRISSSEVRAGDLCFYAPQRNVHVAIMVNNSSSVHGNLNGYTGNGLEWHKNSCVYVCNYWDYTGSSEYVFVRPNYSSTPSYYVDVNMFVNGTNTQGFSNVTFDMYINGSRVADDAKDYYAQHPKGTKYEIKDIKVSGCYKCDGSLDDPLSGTVNDHVNLNLAINTYHYYGSWAHLNDTQHQRTCSRCSKTENANHSWNSGSVTKSATCTAAGVKTYSCTVCGATKTENIAPLQHDFVVAGKNPATCITPEETVYVCSRCGETKTEAQSDGWTDWSVTPPPAGVYKTESKKQYRYSDLQTTTSSSSTLSGWTQTGKSYSAWGSWSDWGTSAVSENDTTRVEKAPLYRYYCFRCSNCGMRDPYSGECSSCGVSGLVWQSRLSNVAYANSNYSTFGKPYTTSLGDGLRWYFSAGNVNATAVGTKDTESDAVVIEQGYRYCKRSVNYSFEKWSDYSNWSDTVYTSTDNRKVETRTLYRYIASSSSVGEHVWSNGTVTTAATCTTPGVITYTCSVCSAQTTEEVSALGHSWSAWRSVNDTQHQRVCSRNSAHKRIADHSWDDGVVTKTATPTATGIKTFTCTVCGATKTSDIPKTLSKIAVNAVNVKTGVKLSWKKDENASGYIILRKLGTTGKYAIIKRITSNATVSYIDASVTTGSSYKYVVRSYRGSEYGPYKAKSITFLKAIRPTAANTKSGVTLYWKEITGASGYYVLRKAGTGSYKLIKKIVSGATVRFTDTSVQNGVSYSYIVRAFNGASKGSYVYRKIVRLSGAAVDSLTNTTGRRLTVAWTKNAEASGYQVQYAADAKFTEANTLSVKGAAVLKKTITGLTRGEVYYVRVRAYKIVSGITYRSAWSTAKSLKITK